MTLLATCLLDWYEQHARNLPWRNSPNPYIVLVSEIMLQQTRVETVIPYFTRWMERFPTIEILANSSQQEVLKVWEGLGYYSRARNLHCAARSIMVDHHGELPQDMQKLRSLPGIGRYSAGAIGSIAFGFDEPALDGNIRRVLARVFDVRLPVRSRLGEQRLWELVTTNLPCGRASQYNQALMDLGAMVCTPRAPNCLECPLKELCEAVRLGVQSERPVIEAKPRIPHYTVAAAVMRRNGQVLIAQRPVDGLLGGMWEFPGGKLKIGEDLETALKREICEELGVEVRVGEPLGVYQHAFTHFRITLHAFYCDLIDGQLQRKEHSDLCWVEPALLSNYPMGKVDRRIANYLCEPNILHHKA
jgi:A/G-specific adenine glycosylase